MIGFRIFLIYFMFVFLFPAFSRDHSNLNFELTQILPFTDSDRSLINSVAFHPESQLFCVTFSHNNKVIIYAMDSLGQSKILQTLEGVNSELNFPASAVFSYDGKSLIVANYGNKNFTVYPLQSNGLYQNFPAQRYRFDEKFRPHGMKISPDGNYLAVTYCSYQKNPKAIEIYKINHLDSNEVTLKKISVLQNEEINKAVPKGVAFSPDGSCILVTFSRNNSIAVYEID